jgi:hypothetical protein
MKKILVAGLGVTVLAFWATSIGAQETSSATAATEDWEKPSAMTHDLAGKEACMVCHAQGATPVSDVPEDHAERPNETCLWCHASDSPMLTVVPSGTPHQRATSETDCLQCHTQGGHERAGPVPESHEARGNETCMWCHVKVEAEGGGGRAPIL